MTPLSQIDDGLVENLKFAALQREAQLGFDLQPCTRGGMHGIIENHISGLAAGLGAIHRRVGVAQHLVRRMIVRLTEHHAETGPGKYRDDR